MKNKENNDNAFIIWKNEYINTFDYTQMTAAQRLELLNSKLIEYNIIRRKDSKLSKSFINGKIISDFHVLDKTYIYTLNVSATQELHKIIIEQRNKINDLEYLNIKEAIQYDSIENFLHNPQIINSNFDINMINKPIKKKKKK